MDKLFSSPLNFAQGDGNDARLNNWKTKLQVLYKLLNEAEGRQLFDDRAVKSWLDDVRDLAYDLEDLLDDVRDDFAIQAAKLEQGAESSTSGGLRKRKRFSFASDLVFDRNVRSKASQKHASDRRRSVSSLGDKSSSSLFRCKALQGAEYDIFLSFRGTDTRKNFVDILHLCLEHAGLRVFLDDKAITGGKRINAELIGAIHSSKILMPIFSRNYATSESCLMELAEIVKCSKLPAGQEILAIYFDVSPSDVKLHRGPYIEALHHHRQEFDPETVQQWEGALKEVTKMKGWELEKETNGFQGRFAKFIVRKVLKHLETRQLKVTEYLVVPHNHVEEIMSLLQVGSDDVRFLIIYGMPGIGKTTLAKVIYNLLLDQFDCCAFLPDIQEESRQKGLEFLWNQLVSQLLKVNLPESHGTVANEGRFSAKEVLILLDDVSEVNQLDALVGKGSRFDRRSRILITTRNKDIRDFILDFSVVNRSYELSGMGFDQSLTLFSRHAFGSDYPLDEYAEYSKRAIEISGGHPLALEVIASFTKKKKNVIDSFPSTKRREAWERSLKMLEEVPHEDIQKRFGIILNDLTNQQMQIFLDIAFYFIGVDERIAIHMWDGQLFPEAAIEKLHQSSLIKIEDNKLWMHNLIRDIARKNSRASNDRPGEQSRWCNHGEALKMLEEKKGTETVEGLALDFDSTYPYCLTPDEFRCLPNLRFLQLNGMKLAGNFRGLLQKLRWLNWHRCPSDVLPTYLDLSSVTVLDLSRSTISEKWGGWHHIETAVRLKVMILMGCSKLTRTPNFSAFPALERVILEHCEELIEFHTSLGRLKHLVSLNLRECTSIKELPEELFSLESLEELLVDGTLIREIRILSGSLTKLQTLSASGCTDLTQVHSSIGSLESLLELLLDNTKIAELPYSIGSLSKLKVLSLRRCRHLSKLPESIEQLELLVELDLSNTGIIELPASIGKLKCLNVLGLDGRLRDIESRLQEIFRTKDLLNLEVSAGDRSTLNQDAKRLPSSSLEEPCFVGRKEEENKIIQLLTRDESHTIPTIISIAGMGGIGKTTLAQRVYNDIRVTQHFEIKAWTCVSEDFDVFGITRAILQSISHLPCEGKDLNWLQVNLKENLLGKKFLIVLDDIWNQKYGEWTTLLKPFKSGAKGSKVIITTRIFNTASIAGGPVHRLNGLQDDVCLALFTYHAFGVNNFDHHSHLQEIGKKLVHKCRGLPLAAKTLGGLLRTKVEPSEWEAILNSKLWDFLEGRDEILPALKLSYVHLPFHLKRCFAYCAIFPKDYGIKRDKLIHWWMAEGFLGENNGKNKWDIGLNYFNELVSRSFFQQGKGSRYFMHDLIHDLAMSISGETCFSAQELESKAYENNVSLVRARYASFVSKHYVTSEKLKRYHGMKKLRSFVTLQDLPVPNYISQKALHELVSELKNVRVFSMSHHHIIEVPNSICELKHLRHLDFSYTSIQTLPKSIGSIYNLEALLLRGCKRLSELPCEIEKLYNLQYLDIRETPNLRAMPSNLANLKILLGFVVGTQKGSSLKELKHLMHPEGKLFISELQRVEVVGDAKDVNLHEKHGIGKLVLQWAQDFNNSRNKEHENAVLEFLQPHINLKILRISYYGGTIFPSWLGSALYTSIVRVDVCGCHNVTSLPSLGQLPSLKQLHIEGLNSITKVGNEFYGIGKPFPSLKTLVFCKMSAWENWSNCEGVYAVEDPFKCLEHLIIQHCPKLVGRLPRGLDSLIKLKIDFCPCLKESLHVISLPSLQELYLRDCDVRILNSLVDLNSLITLKIKRIPELTSFKSGFTKSLVKLERLKIEECEKLNYLWRDSDEIMNLASLRSLSIERCSCLASLMAMPPYLQELCIMECDSLLVSKLESSKFPASLKSLKIERCRAVESITQIFGMEHQWIEEISINTCNNLKILELDGFSYLKELYIRDCGTLDVERFPPFPSTMTCFELKNCPNIKCLPNNLHKLTSMVTLRISGCKNIECLPEGGLPPNLCEFHIWQCENMKTPMREWGLHRLTSLDHLSIAGNVGGVGKKPCFFATSYDKENDVWGFLPSSLSSLVIENMREGEELSSGFCNYLPSLRQLYIHNCPKLRYLPDDGLPPSLEYLSIVECGRLQEGFSKPNGDYCHLLHEIPRVMINYKEINQLSGIGGGFI